MNTAAAPDNHAAPLAVQGEPGADLFVINLCASMTPMPSVPKHLTGFESYKLYQVSKMEDGRRRYRLRLGFFTAEADAELIVGSIRNLYPAAFTSCLSDEDLRYIEGFAPRAKPAMKAVEAPPQAAKPEVIATAPAPVKTSAPASKAPVTKPSPAAAIETKPSTPKPAPSSPAPATPAQRVDQKKPVEAELKLEIDLRGTARSAALPTGPASKAEVVPFHVGRGVKVPEVSLELEVDSAPTPPKGVPVVQQTAQHAPTPQPAKPAAAAKMIAAKAAPPAREPLPPPPQITDYIPVLDTTLTLRTLTQAEIDDPNQPKWFVVQLAQSEHPVNLDAMPKLDIFSAYSLYSVAVTEAGTIRHALRLGFFRDDVSAEAVAGYLKTFFADPTIKRISTAEHMRFAEPPRRTEAPAESSADKVVQLKRTATPPNPATTPPAKAAAKMPTRPVANPSSPYAKITKTTQVAKLGAKTRPGTKSLADELKEEARQTLLSESGIRKAPKPQSFLSRLIGKSLD